MTSRLEKCPACGSTDLDDAFTDSAHCHDCGLGFDPGFVPYGMDPDGLIEHLRYLAAPEVPW